MNLYQKPKTRLGKYKINEIAYFTEQDYKANYRAVATRFGILICNASTGEELQLFPSPKSEVLSVAISPEGNIIAGGKADNTIQLWSFDLYYEETDIFENTLLKGHSGGVTSIAFSPDGNILASGSNDGTIRLWEASDGSHKSTLEHGGVTSIVFNPDGKMLVSGSDDGTIRLWEAKIRFGQNRCITTFDSTTDETPDIFTDNKSATVVTSVVFSPNGSILASGHNNGTIHLWNIETLQNKSIGILEKHTDSIRSLDFSSDGRTLASGSKDKTICVWDTKACQHLVTLQKHTDTVFSVVFRDKQLVEDDYHDNQLVSESSDGSIRFWNTETGKNEETLVGGYIDNIESLIFSPNGQVLAGIGKRGWDKTIIFFWDVNTGKIKTSITKKERDLGTVHFSPDSRTFISQNEETIHFWDVNTGKIKTSIAEKIKTFEAIHFSPDGKTLLTIQKDSKSYGYSSRDSGEYIHFWDVDTGEQKGSIIEKISSLKSVHFSPDSKTLVGITASKICFWDVDTGEQKGSIIEKISSLKSVHFSPDSKTLATIETRKDANSYRSSRERDDENISFWDIDTGKQKATITEEISSLKSVHFSPDSKTLVGITASKICFWDVETGKPRRTTRDEKAVNVESIVFSRDSRLLLSVGGNEVNDTVYSDNKENKTYTFCFWDVGTGEPIHAPLEEMTNNIESVIFSSDKTKFASVHSDNLIRLWDVDTGKHESTLKGAQEDIASVAFSLDNRTLACGSRNGMILLWEIAK